MAIKGGQVLHVSGGAFGEGLGLKRILIFGDTPFGTRLAFYLSEYSKAKGEPVLVMHHTDRIESIRDVQWAVWQTYVGMDQEGRPDLIVNAYEQSDLIKCETDPTEAWYTNSRVAAMIALAALGAGVPLIHLSSDHVFRGNNGPYQTTSEPNPINVYGVTKWYGENTAWMIYPEITIIRYSALYGFDVDSPLSAFPKDGAAFGVNDPSAVVATFIAEAAFLLARNILLNPASLDQTIIHIATKEGPISWIEFCEAIPIKVTTTTAGRPKVRQGLQRGLTPSSGWFLASRDPAVQWSNNLAEAESSSYLRFWVDP